MSKTTTIIIVIVIAICLGVLAYIVLPEKSVQSNIYFSNSQEDPESFFCDRVYLVKRDIETPYAALQELLKGPNQEEKDIGFFSNITEAELNDLSIVDGKAFIDFNELQAAGSCRVIAIRAQIEQTLKQFDHIDEVIISIQGETEEVLQP